MGDAVFVAEAVSYAAGNFVCQASVTGNADAFGEAQFAVWVHGSQSSQLLGSEVAEETETVPTMVLFSGDHPLGLGRPPYRIKVEAAGAWKVLCLEQSYW